MIRQVVLSAILFAGAASSAQKTSVPSTAELAAITARGQMLAEYDVAAWHATDAFLALKPEEGITRYYIAKKTDAGWLVAFGRFNESHDRLLIAYEATQGAGPQDFTVKKYDPPRESVDFYFFAARALETSLKDFQGEKRPYNGYVLPSETGQLYVYVLPAQTKTGVYPIGGDARYLLSADGNSILEKHPMHKSILEFDTAAASGKIVMGVHAHVLTDMPEDSDVFYVLTRKPSLPEVVVTGEHTMYLVLTDGKIERRKR